jgi:hypothetical protein
MLLLLWGGGKANLVPVAYDTGRVTFAKIDGTDVFVQVEEGDDGGW